MYQSDQIESYLRNELSSTDKNIFEEMLKKDPLLKNEVRFQEAVIGGISEHRKQQLKARLNQINVNNPSVDINYKVAAVTLAGILTVGSAGWYLADKMAGNSTAQTTAINNIRIEEKTIAKEEIKQEEIKVEKKGKNIIAEKNISVVKVKAPVNVDPEKTKPVITDPDTIYGQDELNAHDKIKMPTGEITPVASKDNLGVKVSVNNNSTFKFHYSFADNKLFLYGDFSHLYEILDFNTKDGKELFLFYQSNFYRIHENQSTIAPLAKVNDPQMIKKLKEAREIQK